MKPDARPTFGSLFAGIGGLDLGLERAGWECRWQAENDDYCSQVLAKHWPHVPNLGDVTAIDWKDVERVDLICGGFPCQPFSSAGKQAGLNDARWLWPLMADAIRHLEPEWVIVENVAALLSDGDAFGAVLGSLSHCGFHVGWDVLPAGIFGAPHRRYRLFMVAHSDRAGCIGEPVDHCRAIEAFAQGVGRDDAHGLDVAQRRVGEAAARVRGVDDVPSARLDRPRLRALGNAVVPQVAEWIGRRILEQLAVVSDA